MVEWLNSNLDKFFQLLHISLSSCLGGAVRHKPEGHFGRWKMWHFYDTIKYFSFRILSFIICNFRHEHKMYILMLIICFMAKKGELWTSITRGVWWLLDVYYRRWIQDMNEYWICGHQGWHFSTKMNGFKDRDKVL